MKNRTTAKLKPIDYQRRILAAVFSGIIMLLAIASCNSNLVTDVRPGTVEVSYGGDNLGVVVDENMKVLHVEPNRAAELAGVNVGDMLDSVDGISFEKEKDKVKEIIHEPKKDKKLKLKIKRDNQLIVLDLESFLPPSGENVATPTAVPPSQDYF